MSSADDETSLNSNEPDVCLKWRHHVARRTQSVCRSSPTGLARQSSIVGRRQPLARNRGLTPAACSTISVDLQQLGQPGIREAVGNQCCSAEIVSPL